MRRPIPVPALLFAIAALVSFTIGAVRSPGQQAHDAHAAPDDGFVSLLPMHDGTYSNAGWQHFGPGSFSFDPATGELQSHGGMGLHWYSTQAYSDFVLELEYKTSELASNSGVFVRVPNAPTSDGYIYEALEIQIYDAEAGGIHGTGAAYDAAAATAGAARPTGEWNQYRITFVGNRLTVELNGQQVLDWEAKPAGKVKSLSSRGYIGLQNHDEETSVWFRNVRVKDLSGAQ